MIGAETIFGDGRDGDLRISIGSNNISYWKHGNTSSPSATIYSTGTITSPRYGDAIFSKLSTTDDKTLTLQRDIYVGKL